MDIAYWRMAILLTAAVALSGLAAYAQEGALTGVVLGIDGKSVPQARVFALDVHGKPWWKPIQVDSDDAGRFTIIMPKVAAEVRLPVFAMKDGLALAWEWAKPGQSVTLHLGAKPVSRGGTVMTTAGDPIPGARVVVTSLSRRTAADLSHLPLRHDSPLVYTSDARGRFTISGLPAEAGLTLNASADGYANVFVNVGRETSGDAVITLAPEATISGRITAGGRGVSGVHVFCQMQDGYDTGIGGYDECTSSPEGHYTLRGLPPGIYNVLIDPPRGLCGKAVEGLKLLAGQKAEDADIVLTPGSVVRGILVEEGTLKPVSDALVAAYGPARPTSGACCQNTLSARDGTYELRLPPGKNMIYYQGNRGYTDTSERDRWIQTAEGQTVENVNFVLRPPDMLQGRVVSADGKPAPDAKVMLVGEFPQQVDVNPDGTFGLVNPVPSPWRQGPLLIMASDEANGLAAMAEIAPGQKSVALSLQQAAYITATVVDTQGAPVPGTSFPIKCHEYIIADGHADERGRVDIGPLPIGFPLEVQREARSSALAVDEDWWKKAGSFILRPGEHHELPTLVLDLNGRSVRLCVMDEKQRPVKDAFVYVTGRTDAARTDEKGQLELPGLPMRGKVTLCALHPTLPLLAVTTVDPDWKYWPGLVLFPLRSATGQITDQQGKPVAGASIRFQNDDLLSPWFGEGDILGQRLKAAGAREPVITDQQGRWHAACFIQDLDYDVMLTDPQGTRGSVVGSLTAKAGDAAQDVGVMVYRPQDQHEAE